MPVHVYGNPCDADAIASIAKKHNLKVIYDASHAFGVKCHCGSILKHGHLSVLSFHGTKVFNTFEGGAIISQDKETKNRIDKLKNFGFNLFFSNGIGLFIKSVRTMSTTTFATIPAFQMEFFGKTFITFGSIVEIFLSC